mgnify:CR=1 FL=1
MHSGFQVNYRTKLELPSPQLATAIIPVLVLSKYEVARRSPLLPTPTAAGVQTASALPEMHC